jgi:hypothetical protein
MHWCTQNSSSHRHSSCRQKDSQLLVKSWKLVLIFISEPLFYLNDSLHIMLSNICNITWPTSRDVILPHLHCTHTHKHFSTGSYQCHSLHWQHLCDNYHIYLHPYLLKSVTFLLDNKYFDTVKHEATNITAYTDNENY